MAGVVEEGAQKVEWGEALLLLEMAGETVVEGGQRVARDEAALRVEVAVEGVQRAKAMGEAVAPLPSL
jgi:hypothetical protein